MHRQLTAGRMHLLYENGFLRYISTGESEILRMIYFAVRDKNWETIPSEILDEGITETDAGFQISYRRHFDNGEIKMDWRVNIEGTKDSRIRFDITGKALTLFLKNRAGFCVLHPIKECAGQPVKITHSNGSVEEALFPLDISPHQPFKDIAGMQWQPGNGGKATLEFRGDLFETEDQRNWTDNSYKTYCTPLALPFPAAMQPNQEIKQSVFLSFHSEFPTAQHEDKTVQVFFDAGNLIPLPPIGVGRSAARGKNYGKDLLALQGIQFGHYRVPVRLSDSGWEKIMEEAARECRTMKTQLELALFLTGKATPETARCLASASRAAEVKSIILLEEQAKCISNALLEKNIPLFRNLFPKAKIGGGTDFHFTELNRSDLLAGELDFVSYSINPQAHAVDNTTLIENAAAQGYTTRSAHRKFDKPVYISPVTLKRRPAADPRQQLFFGAAWTIASIKYLVENGASSITFFEALGENGIAGETGQPPFPVFAVFKEILSGNWTHILSSRSSRPFVITSLMLQNAREKKLILVNHTTSSQQVDIMPYQGQDSPPQMQKKIVIGPARYEMIPC